MEVDLSIGFGDVDGLVLVAALEHEKVVDPHLHVVVAAEREPCVGGLVEMEFGPRVEDLVGLEPRHPHGGAGALPEAPAHFPPVVA